MQSGLGTFLWEQHVQLGGLRERFDLRRESTVRSTVAQVSWCQALHELGRTHCLTSNGPCDCHPNRGSRGLAALRDLRLEQTCSFNGRPALNDLREVPAGSKRVMVALLLEPKASTRSAERNGTTEGLWRMVTNAKNEDRRREDALRIATARHVHCSRVGLAGPARCPGRGNAKLLGQYANTAHPVNACCTVLGLARFARSVRIPPQLLDLERFGSSGTLPPVTLDGHRKGVTASADHPRG